MTLDQARVADLAAARRELGRQYVAHRGECVMCDNATRRRQLGTRCGRGRHLAELLAELTAQYKAAKQELAQEYPGQLSLD